MTRIVLRRPARMLLRGLGVLVGLQVVIVAVLTAHATWRKLRARTQGFPYEDLPETLVGENHLQVYGRGRELYDAMLSAIDSAQESIYLETFIWKGDGVGRAFKERLAQKAAAGVDVYVIFDGFANLVVPPAFKRFPASIHARQYQPIHRPWHLLDPRRYALEHRKLLVVDGRTAFVGGYNLGSLYASAWRDTHLRIDGPAAAQFAHLFVAFWNHDCARGERITRHYPQRFDPLIVPRYTDPLQLTFPIRNMYIAAIERAEQHILLTNAYFVPDHILLNALKAAAGRGVDVQILLPWISNHAATDWVARGYFTDCLRAGIRIFAYKAMMHAKTCTIDGQWSTIGTANLDRLSAVGNYELNVEIYSAELARQMETLFARDKAFAVEITPAVWSARPWYVKLSERILAPLRVLM
jgi:cardiolipin synthase A/B